MFRSNILHSVIQQSYTLISIFRKPHRSYSITNMSPNYLAIWLLVEKGMIALVFNLQHKKLKRIKKISSAPLSAANRKYSNPKEI